jgi:hypothetical protein
VAAEQLQARLLNGETIAANDLIRSSNAVTRILTALDARAARATPRPKRCCRRRGESDPVGDCSITIAAITGRPVN